MKQAGSSLKNTISDLEWLYVPDVLYAEYENCKRYLQMIIPYRREWKTDERFPLILFMPGSAWYRQEMYNSLPNLSGLAKKGFVVAQVQFRESKIACFPAQVQDVKAAIQFLKSKAKEFHIDTEHVFLAGNSSGAHIALITGFTAMSGELQPESDPDFCCPIKGIIDLSGPTDLFLEKSLEEEKPEAKKPDREFKPKEDLLGVEDIYDNPRLARQASCRNYISKERILPPVLMFHGTRDDSVSIEHSRDLFWLLKENEKEVQYYEIEGAGHVGMDALENEILDMIVGFVKRNCRIQ